MPRIKCTSIIAGPDYRGQPGEIIEVPHGAAQQLIMANAAVPCDLAEPITPPAGEGGNPGDNGGGDAITTLDGLSAAAVLALISEGKLTKEKALELELAGANRKGLIKQLQPAA